MNANTVQVKHLSDQHGVAFGTSGVRGLVKDLTSELCFAFVRSFLQEVCPATKRVAVGIDLRPSSPEIAKACLAAINVSDADAIYCGALPTPALAFYAMQNNMPAVMITGSHIPFDRNGIKFYRADGEISKTDEHAIMNGCVFISSDLPEQLLQKKTLPDVDLSAIDCFKTRYTSLFPNGMLQGKRIGVYEHSSVARDVIKALLTHFGAEVVSLERTETFVPIDTEAVSDEDKAKGRSWAKEYDLDTIVSTDGDGDRPLISDEKGEWLRGDVLGVLCANYLQATHVAAPVNVNTVLELEAAKQTPARISLRTKIGSPYVIAGMEQLAQSVSDSRHATSIVGYEANGGFLVGTDVLVNGQILHSLPTRDSVLPILVVLAMSYQQRLSISQLSAEFAKRYTASDRIKDIPTDISRQLINSIKNDKVKQTALFPMNDQESELLEVVAMDETDGLRMTMNSGDIVHLRPSGNAPELRCYAESSDPERAGSIVNCALAFAI
ncbi:phosphomannomutase [Marinomonas sp. GJ51-6]|uniref:phosphomannomutase n=1 Tax=Marinomonas sp. GJ51-6 TaxID=2992802 RepID=UPI002934AC8B|nr:phosphomannomutase [Marinomonas sp. GJ51-6]WOD06195.1 phosphomannomutase [Marinomonas sp. GJ51-6]